MTHAYDPLVAAVLTAPAVSSDSWNDHWDEAPDQQANDTAAPAASPWQRIDLGPVLDGTHRPPQATIGRRDDGAGMFYPGRVHSVSGEPEAMKTWFMLATSAAELALGNSVAYIDFEDDEGGITSRLLALGVPAQDIRQRFYYFRPDGPLGDAGRAALAPYLQPPTTLAVIDGVTEAMGLFGLKPKDDTDVAAFGRLLPRFLASFGPAVSLLDHVNKDRETRGRWSTGSQHKLSGLNGAAYILETIKPLAPGQTGKSRVRVAKDRPGQVRKNALPGKDALAWFADFVVESMPDGSALASIRPPIERDGPYRPTGLMKQIADALTQAPEPLSGRGIEDRVKGNAADRRCALARLIDEGYVKAVPGSRNAVLHTLVRPFTA